MMRMENTKSRQNKSYPKMVVVVVVCLMIIFIPWDANPLGPSNSTYLSTTAIFHETMIIGERQKNLQRKPTNPKVRGI